MPFNLETFHCSAFPPPSPLPGPSNGFVYVFCWLHNGREVPFYVGQTKRLHQRMGDYEAAQFAASTDFRVGTAAKYIKERKGHDTVVRYTPSADPRRDEYLLIRQLQLDGVRLLNELQSYDYTKTNDADEKDVVEQFCEVLLRHEQLSHAAEVGR